MKLISSIAICLALGASAVDAQGSSFTDVGVGNFAATDIPIDDATLPMAIVAGDDVAKGTKTYTTGLRITADGQNFCGGSLITPTHVLTASHCTRGGIRWVSIGSHYVNGTQDGEQIRVVAIMNHRNFSNTLFTNDFAVLELEKPSSFKPVKLAAPDDSDIKAGDWASVLGWGLTSENGTQPYELKRAKLQLQSDEECSKKLPRFDNNMICAAGKSGASSCRGDSGGPLVKELPNGEDVQIGIVSWGIRCGVTGIPPVFARVSRARTWIDSTSSNTCF
ncbi:hypothetical protein PHYBOEH_008967 [Phytophthora boehmeriae]|uniref:Peptidase S1 domain-containing protein n=1 Tax=Phytophthora boehmeriae TaxID=109152 RepID=A0A8T1VW33_9STRA|nr:hypothetical protein PHYBOEH_008967 [Phytophthora boehmeriae]